jgi:hypothetical protein
MYNRRNIQSLQDVYYTKAHRKVMSPSAFGPSVDFPRVRMETNLANQIGLGNPFSQSDWSP